jgi:hypothetical protein
MARYGLPSLSHTKAAWKQLSADPHTRTFKGKKKNWDGFLQFPLPRSFGIVGTQVLSPTAASGLSASTDSTVDGAEVSLQGGGEEDNGNVVTYFLRPCEKETQMVAQRIRAWKKSGRTHHRLVYMPQPTAVVHKTLGNLGLTAAPNVSRCNGYSSISFPWRRTSCRWNTKMRFEKSTWRVLPVRLSRPWHGVFSNSKMLSARFLAFRPLAR